MKNILYRINTGEPAPRGDGDAVTWFYYYKFHPLEDVENFIPYSDNSVEEGDTLWFVVDSEFVGFVPVLRVQEDPMSQTFELWFSTKKIIPFSHGYDSNSHEQMQNGELLKSISMGL